MGDGRKENEPPAFTENADRKSPKNVKERKSRK